MQKKERIGIFVEEIWQWFAVHRRELPWRADRLFENDTERAYRVLISEIMLQQTQVSRVSIIYKRFLESFPSIQTLASATNKEVILAWRGMGYNSRALRLRDAARFIVQEDASQFPQGMDELQSIPGIGHYTAAAIRNFAFNIPTACLDTNIRRIVHRTFYGPEHADGSWPKSDTQLLPLCEEILSVATQNGSAANWHDALMDYGSLVCTKRNPKWDICPLTRRGAMKAAWKTDGITKKSSSKKQEPGRLVGSTFIPNRIFRGRVVDQLRDHPQGMDLLDIGKHICIDWSTAHHKKWLSDILEKLEGDGLVQKNGKTFTLQD